MPTSAAVFRNVPIVGFFPLDNDNVLSGTTTMSSGTPGAYGIAIAASQTVKLQLQVAGMGIEKQEKLPPYEQYNIPKLKSLGQTSMTLYYSVAGAPLTSITIGLYATSYTATGAAVTTLIAQASNGLPIAVGTYATVISLKGLSVPVPTSVVVAEIDVVTPVSSSAVLNGVSFL